MKDKNSSSIGVVMNRGLNVFDKFRKFTNNDIIDVYNMTIMDMDINKAEYKIIEKIIKKNKLKSFSECSQEMQDTLRLLCGIKEAEIFLMHKERRNLLKSLKRVRLIWVLKSVYSILYLFFTGKRKFRRIINIWKNIDYGWNDNDFSYLESLVKDVPNPEKKSEIVYLLWKIKDKKIRKKFKKFGKTPTQLDLLLQQCKKWQIMLTNALNLDGNSSLFKDLTQAVSWSRRCHSLIISDVIRDKHKIVKDLKIIQSTLNWWVHEISFKEYIKKNYSKSDFLLASLPKDKTDPIILNAKKHIWQKYDRMAMILDIITWWDFKYLWKNIQDINKTYCTALVFDAIRKSWCDVPKLHLTPSDILLVRDLTPEYACYCDKL